MADRPIQPATHAVWRWQVSKDAAAAVRVDDTARTGVLPVDFAVSVYLVRLCAQDVHSVV